MSLIRCKVKSGAGHDGAGLEECGLRGWPDKRNAVPQLRVERLKPSLGGVQDQQDDYNRSE
jgi:hypothetical protein